MTLKSKFPNAVKSGLISFPTPSKHKGKTPRKFSDAQIEQIKSMRKAGADLNTLASHFHAARSTIYYVLEGRK